MKDIEKLKKQALLSLELDADTKPQVNADRLKKFVNSIKQFLSSGKSVQIFVFDDKS